MDICTTVKVTYHSPIKEIVGKDYDILTLGSGGTMFGVIDWLKYNYKSYAKFEDTLDNSMFELNGSPVESLQKCNVFGNCDLSIVPATF
mmetsp:Transcript_33677/g.24705  ORF Transcript_33677/g.24705 Transcript_33677/m.24705 type:complete len:89 (-) Transcript_33677:10-276(-)